MKNTQDKKNDKKYVSPFKTLKLDVSGPMTIGIVQSQFDSLWKQLNKIDGSKQPKLECLNKLREACFWMCRSVAEYHEEKETYKEK